ncbi:PP2C family protein-serine/threonine phosphatase [Actinomycetospora straminea]|uniref:PPM-type phosphatase domain-containing protein n=1 Tax=Actinomycetospora straminea TaxID=663607 RepID=A0ABP9ECN2_9PSEU|nr:protein phosphatase 2C domain-containing protein [Actinomycetospora straminea]MDD7934436.1 protein phosphatase 2C domain-containing protein [Actinomycetospora straminea]
MDTLDAAPPEAAPLSTGWRDAAVDLGASVAGGVQRSDGSVAWAERRGPRRHHADAAAAHRGATGRLAVAVADGVGDAEAAGFAARLVADHAVRVAVLEGRPDLALLAAHDLLVSTHDLVPGDAAAVVALAPGAGDPRWRLAWVGDCRALAWDGRSLRTLTADHTVAAAMRAHGVPVHPRLENVLTTSVRTVRPHEVGIAVVDDPGTLLLVSDGVHRSVRAPALAAALAAGGGPAAQAERVLALAAEAGTTDNATVLVASPGEQKGGL